MIASSLVILRSSRWRSSQWRVKSRTIHEESAVMKLRIVVSGLVMCGVFATAANAFPPIPAQIQEAFKADKDYKPFLDTVEGLKSKCDVCHKPGADKKGRGHGLNDFGRVYHDRFEAKKYKAAQDQKQADEALKLFKAAWDKSVTEKNADGKVYGDLIKAGMLPGKNE
jgi:hypothetical protein